MSPGRYWLRAEVDPDDWARESNEVNAPADAASLFTIPGYAANPVAAGTVSATGPTTIPLSTTSFGSGLGSRVFRIIVPPRRGTLNVASGPTFTGTSVVYTPSPGWVGPDRFTYTVQNSSSSFPRYPTPAAVTLNVGGVFPNVSISGAPATMFAGTSARLLRDGAGGRPVCELDRERCLRRLARDGHSGPERALHCARDGSSRAARSRSVPRAGPAPTTR